jgi:transposase
MNDAQAKEFLQEMRDLKMLTILQLLGNGVKQRQIAQMLSVSKATMSRMIPKGVMTAKSQQTEGS